jgi:hypothetical protein
VMKGGAQERPIALFHIAHVLLPDGSKQIFDLPFSVWVSLRKSAHPQPCLLNCTTIPPW